MAARSKKRRQTGDGPVIRVQLYQGVPVEMHRRALQLLSLHAVTEGTDAHGDGSVTPRGKDGPDRHTGQSQRIPNTVFPHRRPIVHALNRCLGAPEKSGNGQARDQAIRTVLNHRH